MTDGKTDSEKRELNVNIVSIVIGALIVISLGSWINLIKTMCEDTIDDDVKHRYKDAFRKFISALVVTSVTILVTLSIYIYYVKCP